MHSYFLADSFHTFYSWVAKLKPRAAIGQTGSKESSSLIWKIEKAVKDYFHADIMIFGVVRVKSWRASRTQSNNLGRRLRYRVKW
jgi:hypothetical protein